jgi:glutathione S-transferase
LEELTLYELTNVDGISVSPFVRRVKCALQAKGLRYKSTPISFFGIQDLASAFGSELKTVPILARGDLFLAESWKIIEWLGC